MLYHTWEKMAEDDIAECVGTQSFSDKQHYFARVDDAAFWSDRERVKTMTASRQPTAYPARL